MMKRYYLGTLTEVPENYDGEGFYTVDDLVANSDWETIRGLVALGDEDAIGAMNDPE